MQRDKALEPVGEVGAPFRLAFGGGLMLTAMRRWQMIYPGLERAEDLRLLTMTRMEMPPKPTP